MYVNNNRRVLTMTNPIRIFWLICWFLGTQLSAQASCNLNPDLSAKITEFHARQISRIEALLRFGNDNALCFGIEQVDPGLLTELTDFDIRRTTVNGAIKSILGSEHPVRIEQHYGVIEIGPMAQRAKSNIFDFVVPGWEAQRGNLQVISWLLHIQLVKDFNPQIQGFAGHNQVAEAEDDVGPFRERRMPVRYLLDKIVAQSTGAAWIVQIPQEQLGNFSILEDRRVWTILEYAGPSANYGSLLNRIAAGLSPKK
jgi:hypothetical protein